MDAQPHDPVPGRWRDRGVQAADRRGAGSDQEPDILTLATVRLCVAQRHGDVLAGAEVDVSPAERRDLAAPQRPVEQEPHDRAVDEAAARGRLRALETTAGTPPPGAGLQDGGALVGRQPAGRAAAGGGVGRLRAPEVRERPPGERPGHRFLAGVAGGPLDGGDRLVGRRRRPAGLLEVADVGGEDGVVQRPSVEPGCELAARRGVDAARVARDALPAVLVPDSGGRRRGRPRRRAAVRGCQGRKDTLIERNYAMVKATT